MDLSEHSSGDLEPIKSTVPNENFPNLPSLSKLVIWETENLTVSQAHSYSLPGYLFVESKLAVTSTSGFSASEQSEFFAAVSKAEGVVRGLVSPEKIYVLRFGESSEKVHFHIVPRTRRLLDAYLSACPDSPPYNGARITAWLWQNSQLLGHCTDELSAFISAARTKWREGPRTDTGSFS
jgi:diadenosine tetraphosphate (Ap4A) HIT family hydrolase